jgi:hypothetical protein
VILPLPLPHALHWASLAEAGRHTLQSRRVGPIGRLNHGSEDFVLDITSEGVKATINRTDVKDVRE